jgi:Effector Associated Constant Component 1
VPSGSTYTIVGDDLSADALRSLRRWLFDVGGLSGPIDLRSAEPRPGELGAATDALIVALGSGGAVTTLVGALVSWLRNRSTDVTIKLVRPDGSSVKFDARRVRGLDADEVGALIKDLSAEISPPETDARD